MNKTLSIGGADLEYRWAGDRATTANPIVLLHEGLGSVSLWRDFPDQLAQQTGRAVFAYSRRGYGQSSLLAAPRDPDYMHVEGEDVLPAVLAAAGITDPILLGHSDGASIALLYAMKFPRAAKALILQAPHVFVEPLTVRSIAAIGDAYVASGLGPRLARHHRDPDHTFRRWCDIWLDPRFVDWNIEAGLERIVRPVLMIQGLDDEYGTVAQLDAITRKIPTAQTLLLHTCGHAPHRDQPAQTLSAITHFLEDEAPA